MGDDVCLSSLGMFANAEYTNGDLRHPNQYSYGDFRQGLLDKAYVLIDNPIEIRFQHPTIPGEWSTRRVNDKYSFGCLLTNIRYGISN